uniref:Exostosin GT47 domain-containing protein n=1 Tax=Davidia involucrata TaxID=16924 RepID=A0A5B7BN06_DAVIN
MEYPFQFQKLFQTPKRRWLFVLSLVAITHLLCQSLMLPYGNALLSLLPGRELPIREKENNLSRQSSDKSVMVNASDLTDTSLFVGMVEDADNNNMGGEIGHDDGPMGKGKSMENDFTLDEKGQENNLEHVEDGNVDNDFPSEKFVDMDESFASENVTHQEYISILENTNETRHVLSVEKIVKPSDGVSTAKILETDMSMMPDKTGTISTSLPSPLVTSPPADSLNNITFLKNLASDVSTSIHSVTFNKSTVGEQIKLHLEEENHLLLQSDLANSNNDSAMLNRPLRKKMRSEMPPKSITSIYEMSHLLVRRRASRAMRPRWSSVSDREILAAKLQIESAPIVKNDRELYAPLFRNVSTFKRSYELMERILKVYVYKDGEKPIFHQPILKGLYASEGWFMKLMEGNKRFVVKNPRKAHLFYMPFSSRMLEYTLYVRNSHNRTNLRQYLKNYSEKLAAKYPFWNRTSGADHFLVACHDWAPYETRHHMERCIKALCNADVTAGFKIGRDVSLPETYVRAARNPLRDLGGKLPSQRHILAFYAGNMHGYLRPILLKYWKNKDPDMKIFGPMPPGVASKMNYIQHMKSSKYCICPKGYEVNSPRVVEAIFYECVPVIISDNFVPPFFEVLDWGAFSVIVAEKDIPNLKDILLSISEEKYLEMQLGVRKVQQHFLWHAKPIKYDLFHMTLHSIWYNRLFQTKLR